MTASDLDLREVGQLWSAIVAGRTSPRMSPEPRQEVVALPPQLGEDARGPRSRPRRRQRMRPRIIGARKAKSPCERGGNPLVSERVGVETIDAPQPRIRSDGMFRDVDENRSARCRRPTQRL